MKKVFITILCMGSLIGYLNAAGTTIFVDSLATGSNSGVSWGNAYNHLQNALLNCSSGDSIFVASGTYYPTNTANRYESFIIDEDIVMLGGFPSGGADIINRDRDNYPAILSGDIGVADNFNDNTYHVLLVDTITTNVVVDGFYITKGNANNLAVPPYNFAGGVFISDGAVISNCVITDNKAEIGSGAVLLNGGVITNCLIKNNSADLEGGGIAIFSSGGVIEESVIEANHADSYGGNIYIEYGEDTEIIKCIIQDGTSDNGGGVYFKTSTNGQVINCLIQNNVVQTSGGGVYGNSSDVLIKNSTIVSNSAANSYGGAVRAYETASVNMYNSIVYGNISSNSYQISKSANSSMNVQYCAVENGFNGNGNDTIDNAGFVDYDAGNYHLSPNSSAINSGLNSLIPSGLLTDLEGSSRIKGDIVDMGAYESPASSSTFSVDACDSYTSPSGKYIWTISGSYKDTIPDSEGYDSTLTINLTIDTVDVSISQNSGTLMAVASPATYQWLNCNSNYSPVADAIDQSFTAIANGNFAVEITQNSCIDTSICMSVTISGILENNFKNNILLYPNPTKGLIFIDLGSDLKNINLTITDINGKFINRYFYNSRQIIEVKINKPAGVYFLTITSENKKATYRIIKN